MARHARRWATIAAALIAVIVSSIDPQTGDPQRAAAQAPSFSGPDTSNLPADAVAPPKRTRLRFLTASDYPPYHYLDEERVLTGFNVSVARAICLELDVTCEVEPREWNELLPALEAGEADAVIASIAKTPAALRRVAFSDSYHYTPGRFVVRRNAPAFEIGQDAVARRSVAVVAGTAHEAFLRTFFGEARIITFPTATDAQNAVRLGRADLLFGDAATLAIWMNGTEARGCCAFRGEAFAEPLFFGDGVSVAVRKGDRETLGDINRGIARIRQSRRLEEIFLQFFPVRIY